MIHDCIAVERAFVNLIHLVDIFDGYCPCQKHPLQRHVEGCWYVALVKEAHKLQKDAKIDPNGVLWREMMDGITERMLAKCHDTPTDNP